MPTAIQTKWGSLSDTGFGRETAGFGVLKTPNSFFPMSGNSLNLDPGLFSPKVMMGFREANSFPLNGQYKNSGTVAGPIFPTNGSLVIPGAIGPDAQPGYGITGSSAASATTISSPITANSTAFALTLATGYAVGDVIQVDVNLPATPTTTECRKIATLTGTSGTVDVAWTYAHASGVAVSVVTAPFTHRVQEAVQLSSFTVEKNLGGPSAYGGESLQFTGARVGKLSINATTTDAEMTMSADMTAQSYTILDSPTPVSIVNESPFVFAEGTLSLFGQTLAQAQSFSMDIENGLVSSYTFNQSHNLEFLSPVTLMVSGKMDVIWDSFDDATWGYLTQETNGTGGALSFAAVHPGSPTAGSVTFSCPNVFLKSVQEQPKFEDVITSTLSWMAFLDFTTGNSVSATIVNASYLPL
jgi:hypothetical protein